MRKEVFYIWLVVVVALAVCVMYVSTEVAECYHSIQVKWEIKNEVPVPRSD